MSQLTTPVGTRVVPAYLEVIQDELQQVERLLHEQLRSEIPLIRDMVQHGCLGGKRFRPILTLLAAKAVNQINDRHLRLAAAIEMIHAATLVHDDILDGAATRRHRSTINSRWGTHGAVLFGDFLFTHAFYLTSMIGDSFACQEIGRSTNTVCEGELQQTGVAGNYATTMDDYFEIISKKTASLCGCATLLGAHFAGADRQRSQQWERVGHNLGLAFQIVDDVLDLRGSESNCGKTLGTDLQTAKPTLPILIALSKETEPNRRSWIEDLSSGRLGGDDISQWLATHNALAESIDRAKQLVQRAIDWVRADDPEISTCFEELGRFLLKRVH